MSKLEDLSSVQVILNVVKALLKDQKALEEIDFHVYPRLFRRTRLFKLPFVNIYALSRDIDEYASPNRYRSRMVVVVDLACQVGDQDSDERVIHRYEEVIEDTLINNLQIPNHQTMLPANMTVDMMRLMGVDYNVSEESDDEGERAIDEAIIQIEVFFVRVVQ